MTSFDAHLRMQEYITSYRDAVARKRRWDRLRTREESAAKRRRKRIAAAVIVCIVLLLALLTAPVASKEPEDPEPFPVVQAMVAPPDAAQEAYENEKIETALLERATQLDDVIVTHYDVCVECCGKTDGMTASGRRAAPYVSVGVDPDVIPLGSDVLVDYGDGEIHYYRADDTGGGVKGGHIDLCVEDHQTAIELGVRTATVWWVEEES